MNNNFKLDMAYIAGLFDAKGIIRSSKSSILGKVWKMEISIADRNIMELIHETLECGKLRVKKMIGTKKHWTWSCSNQDCLFVAKQLWAHTTVKLHKIEQIIDHYEPDIQELGDNLVDLNLEREKRK